MLRIQALMCVHVSQCLRVCVNMRARWHACAYASWCWIQGSRLAKPEAQKSEETFLAVSTSVGIITMWNLLQTAGLTFGPSTSNHSPIPNSRRACKRRCPRGSGDRRPGKHNVHNVRKKSARIGLIVDCGGEPPCLFRKFSKHDRGDENEAHSHS